MNLKELISKGESETLEFKKSLSEWKEIIETISAFSNTKGGIILIGVDDRRKVHGLLIGRGTIEDLTNKILTNTEPKIYPEITLVSFENKKVIAVKVEKFPYDVVLAFGIPYKRVGKSTVKMSKDEYKKRILEIHRKEIYFDGQILEDADIEDIDKEKIKNFIRKIKEKRNLDIEETDDILSILRRFKLLKGDALTNAGILLFGKNPQEYFPQASIKCIRFKGTDVTDDMLDFREIQSDLLTEVEEAEKFIFKNISLRAWIEDGKIERQEKWEYPPKAIREALVNAIVHRDYRIPSKVQVRIFDDRIEFWNPGKLPEGWTVDTLKEEHTSEPFNPIIARIFFLAGYMEEVGTGTNKIIKWCREWELPEPEFEIKYNNIVVIFRKSKLTDEYLNSLGLNAKDKEIIQMIIKTGRITSSDIQKKYGVSRDTANRWLNNLINLNLIERRGRGKAIYYVLKEK